MSRVLSCFISSAPDCVPDAVLPCRREWEALLADAAACGSDPAAQEKLAALIEQQMPGVAEGVCRTSTGYSWAPFWHTSPGTVSALHGLACLLAQSCLVWSAALLSYSLMQ